ncbi:vomeronasal type-1 receptor 1-like [Dipodomys merriami]|uniref:vomeronasal type-1 receptor 1-like n=1 Tax=Dipodomys merriami TaxID=94247 RepID=UPI003855845C
MTEANMHLGVAFLTQTTAGVLGNSGLLCFYNYTLLTGQNVRPTDFILSHLVFANNLVILSKGIPQTIAGLGWKYFLDDAACKVLLYLHRVARGVSLNATCLLSGFQVSKLCTRNACWKITTRFPKCFEFCGYLFWVLQLLVNVYVPLRMIGPRHKQNVTLHMRYRYCSTEAATKKPFVQLSQMILLTSIDVMCLVFMMWASASMVLVLHRHKQRVCHIHSHIPSRRQDHEARAIWTILTLMSMFVSFYCLSAIFTLYVGLNTKPDLWLVDTSAFLGVCFSFLSPFVLISSDTRITQVFHSYTE